MRLRTLARSILVLFWLGMAALAGADRVVLIAGGENDRMLRILP